MQGRSWADLGHILNRLVRAGKEGSLPSGSPSPLLLRLGWERRAPAADERLPARPGGPVPYRAAGSEPARTRRHWRSAPEHRAGTPRRRLPRRPAPLLRLAPPCRRALGPRPARPGPARPVPSRRRLRHLAGHGVRRPRPRGAGTGSRPGARSHSGRDRPRLVPPSDVGERVSSGAVDPPRDRRTPSRPGGPRPDPGPGRAGNCSASFCAGDCPIILQRVDSPVREPECAVAVPM